MAAPTLWSNNLLAHPDEQTYWENQTWLSGTTRDYGQTSEIGGSMQTFIFTRTVPAGLREDFMQWALHWSVNAGPGASSIALSGAQKGSVETLTNTMWGSIKPLIDTNVVLKEYQWRDFGVDHPVDDSGLRKYSPIDRVTAVGVAGTSGGSRLPDQDSSTLSMITASRKHWGRSYVAGITMSQIGTTGRFTNATADTLALALRTAANSAFALPAITNLCIWSPRYRGVLSIRMIQVDDVVDVIRSRRSKQRNYVRQYTS